MSSDSSGNPVEQIGGAAKSSEPAPLLKNAEMLRDVALCSAKVANKLPSLTGEIIEPAKPLPQPRLTPRQHTAITLLVTGHTTSSVAHRLHIHPYTVTRWRLHNPVFATELNRRQNEVCHVIANRVRMMVVKSLRVVDTELSRKKPSSDTVSTAVGVLRATRVLNMLSPGGHDELEPMTDQMIRSSRGPGHEQDDIAEDERAAALVPWLDNPEGEMLSTGVSREVEIQVSKQDGVHSLSPPPIPPRRYVWGT